MRVCLNSVLQLETWTALVAILCLVYFVLKETIMGGKSSRESGRRHGSGSSPRYDGYGYPPSSPYTHYSTPQHVGAPAPFYEYGSQTTRPTRRLDRRYSRISDDYHSLDEVRIICSLLMICLKKRITDTFFFRFNAFLLFGLVVNSRR